MNRAIPEHIESIGNESSYTNEFFQELHAKLKSKDRTSQFNLERIIILAAQKYVQIYSEYNRELSAHEIKKELKKSINHIDKAAHSIAKIINSGNYGEEIATHLYKSISEQSPRLQGTLQHIISTNQFITKTSVSMVLEFLAAPAESLKLTLKNNNFKKTTPRSQALYYWIMILSAKIEPIIGRKFEQSKYINGQYISNKEENDSDFLLSIIHPLDPHVTVSQMETVLKETRKERHEQPWNDYFPM